MATLMRAAKARARLSELSVAPARLSATLSSSAASASSGSRSDAAQPRANWATATDEGWAIFRAKRRLSSASWEAASWRPSDTSSIARTANATDPEYSAFAVRPAISMT